MFIIRMCNLSTCYIYFQFFYQIALSNMNTTMNNFKIPEVSINLELLNWIGFYQMFDPNSTKIKNWNIYQLACITFITVAQLVVFYATFGFFIKMDDTLSNAELMIIFAVYIQNYFILLKIIILLCHSKKISKLFDATRSNFLTSKLFRKNIKLLFKNRDMSIKLTNTYSFLTIGITTLWILFPIVINAILPPVNINQRLQSIFNLIFPVTLQYYNEHYVTFWVMELILAMFFVYNLLAIEVFLIYFCYLINGYHEVLTQSFKDICFENELSKGNHRFN